MTNLTEKWKKGELPEGMYYFKLPNGETMAGTDYCLATYLLTKDSNRCEVLAEVPSFEQWKSSDKLILTLMDNIKEKSDLLQRAMVKNVELKEENTKLKELLKECKDLLSCLQIDDYDGNGLLVLNRINQVLGEE